MHTVGYRQVEFHVTTADSELTSCSNRRAFGGFGKRELALHPLYYGCERLRRPIAIRFAEPDASDGPICAQTRLGRLRLDDNADKRFTTRVGFLHSFGDRRLQPLERDRTAVIERSPLPKPSQNVMHLEI
jgi:hypothetical protein